MTEFRRKHFLDRVPLEKTLEPRAARVGPRNMETKGTCMISVLFVTRCFSGSTVTCRKPIDWSQLI
jgi:hypothetical protein